MLICLKSITFALRRFRTFFAFLKAILIGRSHITILQHHHHHMSFCSGRPGFAAPLPCNDPAAVSDSLSSPIAIEELLDFCAQAFALLAIAPRLLARHVKVIREIPHDCESQRLVCILVVVLHWISAACPIQFSADNGFQRRMHAKLVRARTQQYR